MSVTMQEQAHLSGLCFPGCPNDTEPTWNSCEWPPFMEWDYASVVVDRPERHHKTLVVIGGQGYVGRETDSVLLLNVGEETKKWRKGPALNERRGYHSAVVCNGGVYAIGGNNGGDKLFTIERIDLEDLLQVPSTSNAKKWTTLKCRLSTGRGDSPGVVAVHNRFIVVAGGRNRRYEVMSSVDIIDTTVKDQHTVISGPPLSVPRCCCGMAAIGSYLYVLGGRGREQKLNSVELLRLKSGSDPSNKLNAQSLFPLNSKWQTDANFVVSHSDDPLVVVSIDSCLIVAGGFKQHVPTVEVLDTQRKVVWNILRMAPFSFLMQNPFIFVMPGEIVVAGSSRSDAYSCERLPLVGIKGRA